MWHADAPEVSPLAEHPDLPDYGGACVCNIVPALLAPGGTDHLPAWMPDPVAGADQVVLLVLDGLGWDQLRERPLVAPTLSSLAGRSIHTVVPSTTATALTSIATGLTPGEHGVVGYRIEVRGEVLNVLRWTTPSGDARRRVPPHELQPVPSFLGANVPVVTKAEFTGTGFTLAHLAGVRHAGWRMPSTLVAEVARQVRQGARVVYAYYEGIDKVAHEYGLAEFYDAELAAADRLVADLLDVLPPHAALVITADHGQVDVGDRIVGLGPDVAPLVALQSGEGRFRWLHAVPGTADALLDAATDAHHDVAWVLSLAQLLDEGWFGPSVTPAAAGRLGDVALVARDPIAFDDPADTGPFQLVRRHGSVTSAEMLVPILAGRGT